MLPAHRIRFGHIRAEPMLFVHGAAMRRQIMENPAATGCTATCDRPSNRFADEKSQTSAAA
jgi:hypothetical protein